jgi:tRNA pseudouridine65 synthase
MIADDQADAQEDHDPAQDDRDPPRSLAVLAEGDGWIVVAKPPGLLVHRGPLSRDAPAALQVLRDQLGQLVYPLHRLDRQASGCLAFALSAEEAGRWQTGFADAEKLYLALVRGYFRWDGVVDVTNPMKDDQGILKDARSEVWCLGRCHSPRSSLLAVRPHTGRFHQVRRHVRDLGHPILGDHNHGDTRVNRAWREERGLQRMALHSLSLRLRRDDGRELAASCPLFEDQAALFSALPFWEQAKEAEPSLGRAPLPWPDWTREAWG